MSTVPTLPKEKLEELLSTVKISRSQRIKFVSEIAKLCNLPLDFFEEIYKAGRSDQLVGYVLLLEHVFGRKWADFGEFFFFELIAIADQMLPRAQPILAEEFREKIYFRLKSGNWPYLDAQQINVVIEALSTLTAREEEILRRHFGLGCVPQTFVQIADDFGVSRERVSSIAAKAERKLRHPSRAKQLRLVCCSLESRYQAACACGGIDGRK